MDYTLHLSPDNTKIGNIPNISLPPITTCPRGIDCGRSGKCYALKSWKQYENVRVAWRDNLEFVKRDLAGFTQALIGKLAKRRKLRFFRWHPAGDIPFPGYLDMMIAIANIFPKCRFLAFTKRGEWVEARHRDIPKNLVIVVSHWTNYQPDTPHYPTADVEFRDGETVRGGYRCSGSCKSCKLCWYLKPGERVVFPEH
jgi:hypothetical protein